MYAEGMPKWSYLFESDEALKRLTRSGLFDKLERKRGDPEEWQKVIHLFAKNGAYLTFIPDGPIWTGAERTYYVESLRHIDVENVAHWRMEYSAVGDRSLVGLSWPFDLVVKRSSGTGPLRDFKFDYVMKRDI
jgi:hypothetical protein